MRNLTAAVLSLGLLFAAGAATADDTMNKNGMEKKDAMGMKKKDSMAKKKPAKKSGMAMKKKQGMEKDSMQK